MDYRRESALSTASGAELILQLTSRKLECLETLSAAPTTTVAATRRERFQRQATTESAASRRRDLLAETRATHRHWRSFDAGQAAVLSPTSPHPVDVKGRRSSQPPASNNTRRPSGRTPTGRRGRSASALPQVADVAVGLATGRSLSAVENGRAAKTAAEKSDGGPMTRRTRIVIVMTTVMLFFMCLFLVGITLRMAPLIDEIGKAPAIVRFT